MSLRTDKVASTLQKEVGEYIVLAEPLCLTTISKVEVTPDLKWCKVWVTILGSPDQQLETLKQLSSGLGELHRNLTKKFRMKFVPKISLVLDHGEEYASHINELIRKTHQDEE